MLIVALVMATIGLAALVTAVVTSNAVIAWVCIGASVIGVLLLIVDALRERQRRDTEQGTAAKADHEAQTETLEYPEDQPETADGSDEAERSHPVDHAGPPTSAKESAEGGGTDR
jgi:hypothetical protein